MDHFDRRVRAAAPYRCRVWKSWRGKYKEFFWVPQSALQSIGPASGGGDTLARSLFVCCPLPPREHCTKYKMGMHWYAYCRNAHTKRHVFTDYTFSKYEWKLKSFKLDTELCRRKRKQTYTDGVWLERISTGWLEKIRKRGGWGVWGGARRKIWKRKKKLPTSFDLQQQSLFPTVPKSGKYATYKNSNSM